MRIELFPPSDELCGFLDGIKEVPDDDAPRLVLADYLEEHGHPERGELIRRQCEAARLAAAGRDAWQVERRERDLITDFAERWLAPWAKWLGFERRRFVRGLVDLSLPVADLCRIEAVVPDHARSAAWVERLTAAEVDDPAAAAALLRTTVAGKVVALKVTGFRATAETVREIVCEVAASPAVGQLRELELAFRELTAEAAAALAGSRTLTRLAHLTLEYAAVDDAAAEILADPRCLPSLTSLRVNGWRLSPEAAGRLRARFADARL
jgi:uncharacterized protein (TIGR02996 family)